MSSKALKMRLYASRVIFAGEEEEAKKARIV